MLLQIISVIFFLISIGSMQIHRAKNKDAMIENTLQGQLLFFVLFFVPSILIASIIGNLFDLDWYFSIPITLASIFIGVSDLLVKIYCPIFGIKSKPSMNWTNGDVEKRNLHIKDSIVTLIIGIIFFFLSIAI